MWTENVAWFSNEAGNKGRIEVGQLADLIVPDRDYFACPEDAIADAVSELTIVGGRVVYGTGPFARHDEAMPPPAMPDWSPVRRFGGYGAWAAKSPAASVQRLAADVCGCGHACAVHGHDHAAAWSGRVPAADARGFWGALGCACWAI